MRKEDVKTYKFEKYGEIYAMLLVKGKYYMDRNKLAIGMFVWDEEYNYFSNWNALTVNVYDDPLTETCAFIDTNNNGKEIIDWLIQNGFGTLTYRECPSRYCIYPEFMFNEDKLAEMPSIDVVEAISKISFQSKNLKGRLI